MRILHIITDFNVAGGAERCLFLLARGLKKNGHQVHIITAGGNNLESLKRIGVPYSILPLDPEKKSLANTWHSFRGIRKIIKEGNFQIVHCHHRWPAFLAWILSWFMNFATITTVHVWHPSQGLRARLSFKLKLVVAVSKLMRRQLIKDFKLSADKIRLIYYGIKLDESYKQVDVKNIYQQNKIPSGRFKFINIGRLTEQKGQKYLIEAFRDYVKSGHPDDILLIIGDGKLKPELVQIAGDLLSRNIFFLDSLPNNQVLALLDDSDVFVLSSLWEGLPLTLIEAGLLGKPLIASAVDGIKEVITDSSYGKLVKPKDVKPLTAAMDQVKDDSGACAQMGAKLQERTTKMFSENKMVTQYEQAYRELI